jgi:uncharacterized linocin/CFP29 family protein
MNILKRNLAPLTEKAWKRIEEQAQTVFKLRLSARRVVDVEGPRGLDYAALPLGRLVPEEKQSSRTLKYGLHKVQPLTEVRAEFQLDILEMDNAERGAQDIDLAALIASAGEIAAFEEKAVYYGFEPGAIEGLKKQSSHEPLKKGDSASSLLSAVISGLERLRGGGVEGPYSLVVPDKLWPTLAVMERGYPLPRYLRELLGGQLVVSPSVEDAFLLSSRGGDFRLVLGQDLSIGFGSHDSRTVNLFFSETFTFQVVTPEAVILIS